jgi:hypothetical protein
VLRISHGKDFNFLRGVQRNIVGQLEMSQKLLAMRASHNVFFPGIQFFGEQRTLMISGERFCVRAGFARRRSARGLRRGIGRSRGGTQMARNRFVKVSIAVFRRHGLHHP